MSIRRKGNTDKALEDLNQAVQIDPKYPWAYDDRANLYQARGDLERALADSNEAIRVKPRWASLM